MKTIQKTKTETKANSKEKTYSYKIMHSPVGDLKLVASAEGLAAVLWHTGNTKGKNKIEIVEDKKNPILLKAEKQLAEYFAGKRKKFALPLDFTGTTFQKKVWKALLDIPYGETVSYGYIAKKIGNPKAVRAVGAANGKNPITIIAACHRVIGSSGTLTGYSGGMNKKVQLLELEGRKLTGRAHANTRVMKKN
jgi:methylated-DNA-[protein]-cysteine S-methyltransferase